tara:strand:+ start:255 stop:596 length:342 start_codon:yes stop_codon:yes gene_type:complete
MALHYDITKVQESVSSDNLNYIIWTTVVLGMQNITEDNWKEFYLRLDYLHRMTLRPHDYVDYSAVFTPKLIKNCIGLRTNITNAGLQHSKNESLAKFKNRIFKSYQRDTINSI